MGCGETCMKFILGFINLLFLLAGALMLAFGITAKADPQSIYNIFSTILPDSSQKELDQVGVNISGIVVSNAIFMIILGVIALLIAILGFVGACCMIRWMLIAYAIILIVFVLAQIALIIFAAVYTDKFREEIQKGMYKSLTEKYSDGLYWNGTQIVVPTEGVELAWDGIQYKEKCCGAYNYSDYDNFNWNKRSQTKVPLTCCKQSTTAGENPTTQTDFQNLVGCRQGMLDAINVKGCYDAVKESIEEFIQQYKYIAIGIAIGICVIQVLLIIFAFCLCARANDDKYV